MPLWQPIQIDEGLTGPIAEIDFVKFLSDLQRQLEPLEQRRGGFARTFERTAMDGFNRQWRQCLGNLVRLFLTEIVQVHTRLTTGNDLFGQQIVRGVTHE